MTTELNNLREKKITGIRAGSSQLLKKDYKDARRLEVSLKIFKKRPKNDKKNHAKTIKTCKNDKKNVKTIKEPCKNDKKHAKKIKKNHAETIKKHAKR